MCLGILNGTQVGLRDVNVIGGQKSQCQSQLIDLTSEFSMVQIFPCWITSSSMITSGEGLDGRMPTATDSPSMAVMMMDEMDGNLDRMMNLSFLWQGG